VEVVTVSATCVALGSLSVAACKRYRQAGAARAAGASAAESDPRTKAAPIRSRSEASRASAWR
jgi:hypothetical protein